MLPLWFTNYLVLETYDERLEVKFRLCLLEKHKFVCMFLFFFCEQVCKNKLTKSCLAPQTALSTLTCN